MAVLKGEQVDTSLNCPVCGGNMVIVLDEKLGMSGTYYEWEAWCASNVGPCSQISLVADTKLEIINYLRAIKK